MDNVKTTADSAAEGRLKFGGLRSGLAKRMGGKKDKKRGFLKNKIAEAKGKVGAAKEKVASAMPVGSPVKMLEMPKMPKIDLPKPKMPDIKMPSMPKIPSLKMPEMPKTPDANKIVGGVMDKVKSRFAKKVA